MTERWHILFFYFYPAPQEQNPAVFAPSHPGVRLQLCDMLWSQLSLVCSSSTGTAPG